MEDKANAGNAVAEAAENTQSPAKKATKSKAKTQKAKATHPPTSEMVHAAIKELKDRKGSSLQAIKKYIAATYKVDGEKFAPFIKRYLKSAVTSGAVVQTTGKGASGSFKLNSGKPESKVKPKAKAASKKPETKKVQSVEKKSVATRKPAAKKVPAAKKASESPKKAAAPKKSPAKAAVKAKVDAKALSKMKKTAKAPAAKTKTPKPKKATTGKVVKATAKK